MKKLDKDAGILVVDGFIMNRKIIRNYLGELGYANTLETERSADIFPLLQKASVSMQPIELILCALDLIASDFESRGAIQNKIQQFMGNFESQGLLSTPKLLLLCADEPSQRGHMDGVYILQKPFSKDELRQRIGEMFSEASD